MPSSADDQLRPSAPRRRRPAPPARRPRARRWCASRLARVVQLARTSAAPSSHTTASASGVAPPAPRTARAGIDSCGYASPRSAFHSTQHAAAAPSSRQQRQLATAPRPGRRDDALEQPPEVPEHPLDRRRVEQVGVVLERAAAAPPSRSSTSASVRSNLARTPGCRDSSATAQPRQRRPPGRRVLQDEHHLEERRAAEIALGLQLLHQLLEGHVLVRVRAQARLAHPREQLAERRVAATGRRAAPAC